MSRVAITGLGVVDAYGVGSAGLAGALARGEVATSEVDRSAGYHLDPAASGALPVGPRSRRAVLVGPRPLSPWLEPAAARRMSPPSKLAVAAARIALFEAGLPNGLGGEGGEGADTAVIMATAFGPSSFTERLMAQIVREGPEAASPFYFTECVANAPAAQIAIAVGAQGANVTVVEREAGALLAVAKGAAAVASGRARRALVGAVEEIPPLVHALLDRFGALSPTEVARPFDRRRDGFLAGEGAAVLVLEREDAALARGARPLAFVAGHASAFDPSAPATDWGTGAEELARGLSRGLGRFGLAAVDCDRIVSGASGALRGDRLEARVLRATWGGRALPAVLAPKSTTGEYGGGALAAAVLAASGAPFGKTPGFANPDPELGVVPHDGRPLPPPRLVLATGLAAGGAAAWLALAANEETP